MDSFANSHQKNADNTILFSKINGSLISKYASFNIPGACESTSIPCHS